MTRRLLHSFSAVALLLTALCSSHQVAAQATAGSYSISVKAQESVGTAPVGPFSVPHAFEYAAGFTAGTTDSAIDRVVSKNLSITSSGTSNVDLQSMTDQDGTSIAFAEVVCIAVANTGTVEVELSVDATDGWQGFLKAEGDVLRLQSGVRFLWCRNAGASVTDTTDDQFTFTNTSGSTTATLTYTIFGRSS